VDLEVFYLGHLKNLYTIQYNTIRVGDNIKTNPKFCRSTTVHRESTQTFTLQAATTDDEMT